MIKKIFFTLLGLVGVLIIAFVLFGSGWINALVKKGVETIGPDITQSEVQLERVALSLFSGEGTLHGLRIGNPEGFSDENLMLLGEINVKLHPRSLLSDTIIIERVHVRAPQLRIEQTTRGNNLQRLMGNVQSFAPPSEDVEAKEGAGKDIIIKELIIEEGVLVGSAFGQSVNVKLARIELNNIGTGEDGMNVSDVVQLVLGEVLKQVGPALRGLGGSFRDLGDNLLERGGEASDGVIEQGRSVIRGLMGN